MTPTPEQLIKAHQYLYYVLARPVLSDYSYDMLCKKHGIDGSGGSDLEDSYDMETKLLAQELLAKTL